MNDTQNVEFGFKQVTVENWNIPDPILESFFGLNVETGEFHNTSGSNYAAIILQNELTDKVPEEVCALYYIARNIFLYGIYFYPLYTVGINEISRVMETAISEKCRILSAPSGRKTWKEKMDWLEEGGYIGRETAYMLDGFRLWRNSSSHAERQTILPPGSSIGMLRHATELINDLFA